MSPDILLRQWFEEVWNRKNSAFIHKHLGQPCRLEGLDPAPDTPEKFEQFQQMFLSAIGDMHIEVIESMECGNRTMGICLIKGTDTKSDTPVSFHMAYSATVEDDKIVQAHNVVDFLAYYSQAGVVDPSGIDKHLSG